MHRFLPLFLLLLVATPAAAKEPERAFEKVLAAIKAGDDAALKALAAANRPDPWIVAGGLCAVEEFDAAEKFATAAPRPRIAKLAEYVKQQRELKQDAELHDTWKQILKHLGNREYDELLSRSASIDTTATSVTHLVAGMVRGQVLLRTNRRAEGLETLERVGAGCEKIGWIVRALSVWRNVAQHHQREGRARESLQASERCVPLLRVLGNVKGAVKTELHVGLLHNTLGNHAKALAILHAALKEAIALQSPELEADARANLGIAHFAMGDFLKALDFAKAALKQYQKLGDRGGEGDQLRAIGQVHLKFGDFQKAFTFHGRALSLAQDAKDGFRIAYSLRYHGELHTRLGDYAKSLGFYERALAHAKKIGNAHLRAEALEGMGGTHTQVRDWIVARSHFNAALELYEKIQYTPGIASALTNIAVADIEEEEYDLALEALDRAKKVQKARADQHGLAQVLGRLADLHKKRKEYAVALGFENDALKIYKATKDRSREAETRAKIGELQLKLGDKELGQKTLKGAINVARHLRDRGILVWAQHKLARAYLEAKEYEKARSLAKRALTEIEFLVGGLADDQGAMARGEHAQLFEVGLLASAHLGDVEEAVMFLESGRAGALLESLKARQSLRWTRIPEALRQEEAQARGAVVRAREVYAAVAAREDATRRERRIAREALEAEQAKVQDVVRRIQRKTKGQAAGMFYPRPSPLEDIQSYVKADQALILYSLPLDDALAIVVTQDGARIVMLGSSKPLREACEALDIRTANVDHKPALATLRKLLIEPLELGKDVKRVLLSPEGKISFLPFAAVFTNHEVAVTPNGTTHVLLRKEEHEPGSKVLALGDPDYGGYSKTARAVYARGRPLDKLEFSGPEVKQVGDEILTAERASEELFRETLKKQERWRAVHFACHGLIEPERPTLSSLALSQTGADDGFLTALEVFSMDIPADLAVLSACETGKGKIQQGEGIVGLTRAFMFAGAPRVICSLWKVEDEATHQLMLKFYELWNPKPVAGKENGKAQPRKTAAQALREAQAWIRSHKKWEHPFFWAAWVLWGLPE